MEIIVTENYDEMSKVGAELLSEVVKNKPNAVLGLATGTTPLGTYARLADACHKGELSFKGVKTVNLDEYVGLGEESDQSYVWFMNHNLFDKSDIDKNNTHLPNGKATDFDKECERYTNLVKELRQDVQLLGLGSNGHIAFNEPGTPFDSHTHIVNLTENTIKDNSRLFDDISQVPTRAISMGIADIMQAKKIVILASGSNKALAVYKTVEKKIDESCPASILQKHPNAVLVVDKAAAQLLSSASVMDNISASAV